MEQDVQILLEDHPIFGQMAEGKETGYKGRNVGLLIRLAQGTGWGDGEGKGVYLVLS